MFLARNKQVRQTLGMTETIEDMVCMLGAFAGSAMLSGVLNTAELMPATRKTSQPDGRKDARIKDGLTTSENSAASQSQLPREEQRTECSGAWTWFVGQRGVLSCAISRSSSSSSYGIYVETI